MCWVGTVHYSMGLLLLGLLLLEVPVDWGVGEKVEEPDHILVSRTAPTNPTNLAHLAYIECTHATPDY